MRHLALFTLYFAFTNLAFGQNLIPNPSAEEYIECPTGLGILETWVSDWQSFRGTADYFNNCSNGLSAENPFGFQNPRTGEGFMGLISFHQNLENYREYIGVELIEPLIVNETYTLSFYVSLAHKLNVADRATDNLGFLLMETNTLDMDGQGVIPNYASFAVDYVIDDSLN